MTVSSVIPIGLILLFLTVLFELLPLYMAQGVLLVKISDLKNMCYTVIAINFITHPVAYLIFSSPYSGSRAPMVSEYAYVIVLLILEALVISVETVLISWSMRYSMLRSFTIACLIQVITLVLSVIFFLTSHSGFHSCDFCVYSSIFLSLVCFCGGILKLRDYKQKAKKNSLTVAFIFFAIGFALLYVSQLLDLGVNSLGNGGPMIQKIN